VTRSYRSSPSTPAFRSTLLLASASILLIGCASAEPAVQTSVSSPVPSTLPAATPQTHLDATVSPTSAPTVTPTRSATLSPEEESLFWLKAISENMGCQLPCWWGLTPGVSTWNDLDALFRSIGGPGLLPRNSQATTRLDFIVGLAPRPDPQPAYFAVFEQLGLLTGFDVSLQLHGSTFSSFPAFDDAARSYSLANLLATAGPPTQVLVHLPSAQAEPGAGWIYGIWLYYEDKATAAYYGGEGLSWRDGNLTVCPAYESVLEIRLWLRDSARSLTLEQITGEADIPARLASGQLAAIEAASSLTTHTFYQLLRAPDACFQATPTR
jgi:hypothetical protein